MTFLTVAQIKAQHKGRFFSKETVRFFGTRIMARGRVFGGRYFVTSERCSDHPYSYTSNERRFSVRRYDAETDTMKTIGGFQKFATAKEAVAFAEKLARGES